MKHPVLHSRMRDSGVYWFVLHNRIDVTDKRTATEARKVWGEDAYMIEICGTYYRLTKKDYLYLKPPTY